MKNKFSIKNWPSHVFFLTSLALYGDYSVAVEPAVVTFEPTQVKGREIDIDTEVNAEQLNEKHLGDLQGALRSTPGVFTGQSENQPGIEVNIRGLSGYGRVNTQIDGVPQNMRNASGHSSSGGNLLYVQPELLAGVDVSRGAVSGAKGMGTLAGAVNMRTLRAYDVLLPGHDSGAISRITLGNNGVHGSGMLGYAQRFNSIGSEDGFVSVLGAVAYSSEGNYKTGEGKKLDGSTPHHNKPKGGLFRVEFEPNLSHHFNIGANGYQNTFLNSNYDWKVKSGNYSAQYQFTPDNPLIDTDIQAYYSHTGLDYLSDSGSYAGRRLVNETYGINLSNNSIIPISKELILQWNNGLAWQRDDFQPKAKQGANNPGKLDKTSVFTDLNLNMGAVTLLSGLRYDSYKLNGYRPSYEGEECISDQKCSGDTWLKKKGGKFLPKLGAEVALTNNWQFYGLYSHTYRPPTTHEMFYAGAPFGDGKGDGIKNNPHLKPELSRGWDFALTQKKDGLFVDRDSSFLRIGYFNNRIKNYIVNDFVDTPDGRSTSMWVNTKGKAHMYGWEIEANYDMEDVYAKLAYTYSKTDSQPTGAATGAGAGEGSVLPRSYWTLDIGGRTLQKRMQLGALLRYVGQGKEAQADFQGPAQWKSTDSYYLVDLYGHYQINKHIKAFWNVENVLDKAYGYAGSSLSGYEAQTGRGRTFRLGLEARF